MESIIAKIDNDFNPDNSDWINRVPAWCVDAMQQLKILSVVKKKRKLNVNNRIAYSPCNIINNELKVYDKRGCAIANINDKVDCGCQFPTGKLQTDNEELSDTMSIVSGMSDVTYGESIAVHNNDDDINKRNITFDRYILPVEERNYVLVDANHIELNFDTDYIYIENLEVETQYSEYFQEEIPVIPNDGNLIEALAYYCMYKMLCRGMKHPVFNLNASQYGTNPYYMWMQLKSKARASVINTIQGNIDTKEWQNYFYNYTFKPRG